MKKQKGVHVTNKTTQLGVLGFPTLGLEIIVYSFWSEPSHFTERVLLCRSTAVISPILGPKVWN